MNPARTPEGGDGKHPAPRSRQDERKEARDQLAIVLGFFSRVDAKASALLAIDTGMLAILTANALPLTTMSVMSVLSMFLRESPQPLLAEVFTGCTSAEGDFDR
jgi:hypothetical protein